MNLFGSFQTIERSMDYSALKHEVTSQNIANADTPNYKGKKVSFGQVFDEAVSAAKLRMTDPRHISAHRMKNPAIALSDRRAQYGHNGNNVDIDKEMSDLAANQIYYSTLSERLSGKFNLLQNVIKGGK
ncbi:flagellar basal body rod protein FlgB [Siminovitchia fortis]|uniref:Flagellar basal body rod protein FlgB n=1 Tax=Siminovitchia fortis TaxID=254758 RepID=A0A443J0I4_9BACI|nr:flagellar basal body rod protein FlgB [Siminovitchia fortis]RWR14118.1 flagellar basal body rod protein FlgB [Siminovitchia fortis]WHY83311.1 flagellar basal body rod protein FlgB [Siminovitchia fortis]